MLKADDAAQPFNTSLLRRRPLKAAIRRHAGVTPPPGCRFIAAEYLATTEPSRRHTCHHSSRPPLRLHCHRHGIRHHTVINTAGVEEGLGTGDHLGSLLFAIEVADMMAVNICCR